MIKLLRNLDKVCLIEISAQKGKEIMDCDYEYKLHWSYGMVFSW